MTDASYSDPEGPADGGADSGAGQHDDIVGPESEDADFDVVDDE
jgi:hypothetical protein